MSQPTAPNEMSADATQNPTLDRHTASRLNPLIDPLTPRGTLENAANLVGDIGTITDFANNLAPDIPTANIWLIAGVIRAALEFEAEAMNPQSEVKP